jgi:hypothetical protein
MRDIREDLLERSFGVFNRCAEAMAKFDQQLQNLLENHRKLMKDLNGEKLAVEALLAIESSRPACDIKNTDAKTTASLRTVSQMTREFPWEKLSQQSTQLRPPSSNLLTTPADTTWDLGVEARPDDGTEHLRRPPSA